MDPRFRSREVFVAWINHRLELVSRVQHELAVQKTVLQEQATRLRLGVRPDDVWGILKHAGLSPVSHLRSPEESGEFSG